MLTRCTRAYSSFCSQVVLVYCHSFDHSSLFCSRKLQKITKTPIFVVQSHSKSLTLIPRKSTSSVLVMISCMSVPICKHFRARQENSQKITIFRGQPSFTLSCAGLFECRGLGLDSDTVMCKAVFLR